MPFFFLIIRRPPRSTLFPYTSLFRSRFNPMKLLTDSRSVIGFDTIELWEKKGSLGELIRPLEPFVAEGRARSEEHTSELQSRQYLVCRLLLEKKNEKQSYGRHTHNYH